MQSVKWITTFLFSIILCHIGPNAVTAAGLRIKRQDVNLNSDDVDTDLDLLNSQDNAFDDVSREKRKVPDAAFEAKNAVLGFVFNKIDGLLDTKTRLIEQLDQTNIEKNKEYDIRPPVPIKDLQSLFTAVVSPKIRAVGNFANDLTTGVLTTVTVLSGSKGGDPNAGLGNIVSKFLSFSGPILQGSAGGGTTTSAPDSDEDTY